MLSNNNHKKIQSPLQRAALLVGLNLLIFLALSASFSFILRLNFWEIALPVASTLAAISTLYCLLPEKLLPSAFLKKYCLSQNNIIDENCLLSCPKAVTLQKLYEDLQHSEQRWELAAMASNSGLWDWNLQTDELYFSNTLLSMLEAPGIPRKTTPSIDILLSFTHPDDRKKFSTALEEFRNSPQTRFIMDFRVCTFKLNLKWVEMRAAALRDNNDKALRIVGNMEDITERKDFENTITYQATHDPLTSLPNRAWLANNFKNSIEHCKTTNSKLAVLFMDLDKFKSVNDTLGHASGDDLLIFASKRLKSHLRKCDYLARFGGDEFTLVLHDITSLDQVTGMLQRILHNLEEPFRLEKAIVRATGSIGAALYPDNATTLDNLLAAADKAMYKVKQAGGNGYCLADTKAITRSLKSEIKLITPAGL